MKPPEQQLLVTVTVVGSQVLSRAGGATALALTTKERGTIAFAVTLETIAILRRNLDQAEILLRPAKGSA